MSNKNPGKFFYYPAPPPHIINYFLIFVKHFLALFFGQIFWLKKNKISCKRQASSVRQAFSLANAGQRTMRASEASEQGAKAQALPRPPSQTVYHRF